MARWIRILVTVESLLALGLFALGAVPVTIAALVWLSTHEGPLWIVAMVAGWVPLVAYYVRGVVRAYKQSRAKPDPGRVVSLSATGQAGVGQPGSALIHVKRPPLWKRLSYLVRKP